MSDKERVGISQMRKSTPMETMELIELVRQRPCLWDRYSVEYRGRVQREKSWIEVCRALDPSYDELTRTEQHDFAIVVNRKWYNIRDCYKKYLNGTARFNSRPYMHAEQLSFLDKVYGSKEEVQKTRKRTRYSSEDQEEPQQEEWLNEVLVEMENTADEPPPEPTKNVKMEYPRTKETVETDDSIVSVLVNLIEKEDDEDRAFFKSITPAVKSLCDDDKMLFRIQVMKLLKALIKNRPQAAKLKSLSQDSDTD